MNILSFDPGEMTGISYSRDGIFQWGMTATASNFKEDSFFRGLYLITQPTVILIESIPRMTKFPNTDQRAVYDAVVRWFSTAGLPPVSISPGQWKNLVPRSRIECTHIKDATDMASWYYRWKTS